MGSKSRAWSASCRGPSCAGGASRGVPAVQPAPVAWERHLPPTRTRDEDRGSSGKSSPRPKLAELGQHHQPMSPFTSSA